MFDRLARREPGSKHAGTSPNGQRIGIACKAAGKRDKPPGMISLGKGLRPPSRQTSTRIRDNPNLENQSRYGPGVIFGVPDAGAGAHHLDVSRFGLTFVAETIPVGHHPFAHIGDDFHVGMRMGRKACIWSDLIIVPDTQRAPTLSGAVVRSVKRKVPFGLYPADILAG